MKYYFKLFFSILLIVFVLWLIFRRYKKFSFIFELEELDYPITKFHMGTIINIIFVLFFMYELISVYCFKKYFEPRLYLIPLGLLVIYFCYGAVPDILENKYKVKVNVDPAARLLGGFDFFGSWVGQYKDGIIIYYYLIKRDTIKVLKNTDEEIIFQGMTETKKGTLPIEVKLRSRPSIKYFKNIL